MKPYPIERRRRTVAAVGAGGSRAAVAARSGVSLNCASGLLRLRQETGALRPRPNGGGRAPAIGPQRHDELRRLIAGHPDLQPHEARDRLGLGCSLAAVSRTLEQLGLARKKKRSWPASSSAPTCRPGGRSGPGGRPS